MEFESVRLFAERAQTINPSFTLTPENAGIVGNICYDLDGIPLAIELASARIKVLPVDKIHERLSDRFKLLTGGRRTALPRQQTLKALIDWSYDLLSDQEKMLWERLSVFSGGWSLESAEEICSDEKIESYDVLDLLFNLTEKSIIIFDADNERYRMLESIRQYGDEKLGQSESRGNVYSKHLKYFMDLAVKSEDGLAGDNVTKWLSILDNESGNMEAALNWSYNGGDNEDGGKLAVAYANYWLNRGHLTTAIYFLENILEKSPGISKNTKGNLLGIALGLMKQNKETKGAEVLSFAIRFSDSPGVASELSIQNLSEALTSEYGSLDDLVKTSCGDPQELTFDITEITEFLANILDRN